MAIQYRLGVVVMGIMLAGLSAPAQTKEVTVPYLRAAVGSLPDQASVTFQAVYVPGSGMVEATGWNMRGKGITHFSVRDPLSPAVFAGMYCTQDSKAFKQLVAIEGAKVIRITGYKGYGDGQEAGVYATNVEILESPVKKVQGDGDKAGRTFRVTVKDTESGTKTVLANVSLGKTYTVEGLTLTVEAENEAGNTGGGSGANQ